MIIVQNISELKEARKSLAGSVAFVPTMGNLHEGHLSLVQSAKEKGEHVVVSIFVNPLQFGPNEDFDTYPRTLAADIEKLKKFNVDILFTPAEKTLYPEGKNAQSFITVPVVSESMDGERHPMYFSGIATVVAKLFQLVQPDVAIFGLKDHQQFMVIKKFVKDLNFPVELVLHETVREQDGLAMSSRNSRLSDEERQRAPKLYKSLARIKEKILERRADFASIILDEKTQFAEAGFNIDYLEVRRFDDLGEAKTFDQDLIVLVGAYLGQTRLIDNIVVFA